MININVHILAHFIISNSFCFIPLNALFLLFHDRSFALSGTLLPMLGPKFRENFVFDSNVGFRSGVRLSLNVQLFFIKAYCRLRIFFGF